MPDPADTPLRTIVERKLLDYPRQAVAPYLARLDKILAGRARAVVVYGSTLSHVTRTSTSTPDFYVIVSKYRDFYPKRRHALMNYFLPPNVYRFDLDGRVSKYNIISEKDLAAATSPRARDVYHLGRFSKRIALAWSRDDAARAAVLDASLSALRAISRWTYRALPPRFTLREFAQKALSLSYEGEFRVEAPDKIDRLYAAEQDHYDRVFALLLAELGAPPWRVGLEEGGAYVRPQRYWFDRWNASRLLRFLRRSRLRAKLRWPKSVITVEGWVDYLLEKIERTHGIRIELTERERRHPLIYGWKHLFRLRRQNVAK